MSAHIIPVTYSHGNIKDRPIEKYDTLVSSTTSYMVEDFLGEGAFGKCAKCMNLSTQKKVAVKIPKGTKNKAILREVEMLQAIRNLDPNKNNIVEFVEYFMFKNISCLAFEMLDMSLWDLMEERQWKPLRLNEIRPVIHQLMVAFDALKSLRIIHTDLKLDNIMLVNHKDQPFRIKLIDFGLARRVSEMKVGMTVQVVSCRAPEVTLGLPLTEAIDMWAVGCTMAFLYYGTRLFPSECCYNLIRCIVHLLGQPPDHILSVGKYTSAFFSLNDNPDSPRWRLRSPDEYQEVTNMQAQLPSSNFFDSFKNLEDVVRTYPAKKNATEYKDRMAFLSLLKSTLDLDAERRITPREALNSDFLSMVHLQNKKSTRLYPNKALQCMTVLPVNHVSIHEFNNLRADLERELEQKKLLQIAYEKMQEEHRLSQEKLCAKLHAEKERTKTLQKQLDRMTLSLHEVNLSYETDVTDVREQVDTLRADLGRELQQKELLQTKYMKLQQAHKLRREKFTAKLHAEKERTKTVQDKLDRMTVSLHEVNLSYQADLTDATQQVDTIRADLERKEKQKELLQKKYVKLQQAHKLRREKFSAKLHTKKERNKTLKQDLDKIRGERDVLQKITIPNAEPLEPTTEAELPQEMQQETISPVPNLPIRRAEPPSLWKRIRHALGLRKPERWKRRRREEEN
ncbi:Homeodomain-interacting protein kinase 1 [Nibea albiflora]|uniref:Homeodomain-interacting protein kinase 1 n=1 Tax=Nibea albiflora TaxID=240163 RepID=A0ACB7FDK6_NIBAL|nr:Homeodomain-interacting protein kinase 1 [Nibea albiflora]